MQLSIIIPVYNVERFLKQCLDSVLAQTVSDYEVICVNDGSTDSSPEILRDYEKKYQNLTVINQTNHGLGYARNVGIEHAKGDWIAFVDSDDFIAPEMFEKMLACAGQTGPDVVVSNPYIYEHKTKAIYPYRKMLDFYRLSILGGFPAVEHPKVFAFLGSWDKIYRRSLLTDRNIRFPVNRIYEDAPFSYQALALAKKVAVVKECYYYYRKNAGAAITDKEKANDAYKLDFLKNTREIKAFLKESGIYEQVSIPFLTYILRDGMFHHSNTTTGHAFRHFFREMRDILDEEDGKIIQDMKIKKFCWYYDVLQNDNQAECKRKLPSKISLPETPEDDTESEEEDAK